MPTPAITTAVMAWTAVRFGGCVGLIFCIFVSVARPVGAMAPVGGRIRDSTVPAADAYLQTSPPPISLSGYGLIRTTAASRTTPSPTTRLLGRSATGKDEERRGRRPSEQSREIRFT